MSSMLKDKTKAHDRMYRCRLRQNKMRDMTDRIGVVYARRQNERTRRIISVSSTLNKTRGMMDRIGVVYAGKQNERT